MSKLLHFQQLGQGQNIVFIHGLFGSLENLNMVAKPLSQNYQITNVDVRNHGKSFHENKMDYATLATDIVNLLDSLNIEKTSLLGHSMGGKIAMEVALKYPDRINKLIVADIAPVDYQSRHDDILAGLKLLASQQITNRKAADAILSDYVSESGVRQFLLRNLTKHNNSFVFKCNVDFIDNCYADILKGYQGDNQFKGDTLFIKGGNSDYIIAEYQQKIHQHFPNASAKIIQGTGHWLHAEKTVAFTKIVNDFLAKNTR